MERVFLWFWYWPQNKNPARSRESGAAQEREDYVGEGTLLYVRERAVGLWLTSFLVPFSLFAGL